MLETDAATGETSVLVTYVDDAETVQTARVSLETAAGLGLVLPDKTSGETIVNEAALGTMIIFDPVTLLDETGDEEDLHPVASALSDFFGYIFGVDYETVMTNHEEGLGFGVIAQALWMTNPLGGDTATFKAILDAKKAGIKVPLPFRTEPSPPNGDNSGRRYLPTRIRLNTTLVM